MANLTPFALRGETVLLRPLDEGDTEALAQAASQSRENYAFTSVPGSRDDALAYIRFALGQQASGERLPFAVIWMGQFAGTTSFLDIKHWPGGGPFPGSVEIGYTWLSSTAQRTRCNTEAKLLLLTHAFEAWGVQRVAFKTDERNRRSRAAIERLGAVYEGIRRCDMPAQDGGVRSSAYYSIVACEWPEVKAKLEVMLDPPIQAV